MWIAFALSRLFNFTCVSKITSHARYRVIDLYVVVICCYDLIRYAQTIVNYFPLKIIDK